MSHSALLSGWVTTFDVITTWSRLALSALPSTVSELPPE